MHKNNYLATVQELYQYGFAPIFVYIKSPHFLFLRCYISLSRIVYKIRRSFRDESSSQSLCHPSGSRPSLGGWSLPSNRQQRSVDTFPLPWSLYQNGELNCWVKISGKVFPSLQPPSRTKVYTR